MSISTSNNRKLWLCQCNPKRISVQHFEQVVQIVESVAWRPELLDRTSDGRHLGVGQVRSQSGHKPTENACKLVSVSATALLHVIELTARLLVCAVSLQAGRIGSCGRAKHLQRQVAITETWDWTAAATCADTRCSEATCRTWRCWTSCSSTRMTKPSTLRSGLTVTLRRRCAPNQNQGLQILQHYSNLNYFYILYYQLNKIALNLTLFVSFYIKFLIFLYWFSFF